MTARRYTLDGVTWEARELELPGCWLISRECHTDARGTFDRVYDPRLLAALGLPEVPCAQLALVRNPSTLTRRGLHYQRPPAAMRKLVWVVRGAAVDAMLDLRKGSPSWGQHTVVTLTDARPEAVLVPEGVAHGYLTASPDPCWVQYVTSREYVPALSAGVRWPAARGVLESEADTNLPAELPELPGWPPTLEHP